MKIDCYLAESCVSYHELRENLTRAMKELALASEVAYHTVSYDDAARMGIKGSPSILLNGRDLFDVEGSAGIA